MLAYRVFTELVPTGTPKWRAVRCYTAGLRAYRETLRTDRNKLQYLRAAERAFMQALAEDKEFGHCYYNLGIVYRDIGEVDSAHFAFLRAIRAQPGFADAYYALALYHWQRSEYKQVVRVCNQVLSLRPKDARAWNLQGLAQRAYADPQSSLWPEALGCAQIATALAWRAMCRSALSGLPDEKLKETARTCSRNLAMIGPRLGRSLSAALFRQAIYLAPTDAELRFSFGRALRDHADWRGAISAFESALRLQQSPSWWASLADAHASRKDEPAARDACKYALDAAWGADKKTLAAVEEVALRVGLPSTETKLYRLHQKLDEKLNMTVPGESVQKRVKRLKNWLDLRPKESSVRSRVAIQIAELLLETNRARADTSLDLGISGLEKLHPFESKQPFFHWLLSRAYRRRGDNANALLQAERAVALAPQSPRWRLELGSLYFALEDYEKAEAECRTAYDLNPLDPEPLRYIADTYWSRGVSFRQRQSRQEAFSYVIEFLSTAARLMGNKRLDSDRFKDEMNGRGVVYYWLGRFQGELFDYDRAISNLKIAQASGYKPLETRAALGWIYLEARAYNDAEQSFRDALKEARKQRRQVKSFQRPADAPGEDRSVGELLIETYTGLVVAWTDRGVHLSRAERKLRHIERHIPDAKDEMQQSYQAAIHDLRGWILLRGNPNDSGALKAALQELELSVSLWTDARAYYHLGEACLAYAQAYTATRAQYVNKAREVCVHALDEDLRSEYDDRITDLRRRIDALDATPPKPPGLA